MKAISLHQPWASLIALEEKTYESRSWKTPYRGPLAIHAAKRPVSPSRVNKMIVTTIEDHHLRFPEDLPRGAVLCIVELIDCIICSRDTFNPNTDGPLATITDLEKWFGNYSYGRYAWKLKLLHVFPEPIPALGFQRLWQWEPPLNDLQLIQLNRRT
jgi:hypothetical protein